MADQREDVYAAQQILSNGRILRSSVTYPLPENGNCDPHSPSVTSMLEIPSEITKLFLNLDELKDNIRLLDSRLAPLLRRSGEISDNDPKGVQISSCELGDQIRAAGIEIGEMTCLVRSMLQRLEI